MTCDKTIDCIRRRSWRAIVLLSVALGFFRVLFSSGVDAQNVASLPNRDEAIKPRMFVDPCSTTVSHNKVRLVVGPLTQEGKFYVGSYQLKVFPYFFKSETGTLKLDAPDETLRKFAEVTEVRFTGKATNNQRGKTKVVIGKAMPFDKDKGSLTFYLETDNGRMTFKTTYHFGR